MPTGETGFKKGILRYSRKAFNVRLYLSAWAVRTTTHTTKMPAKKRKLVDDETTAGAELHALLYQNERLRIIVMMLSQILRTLLRQE